MARDIQQSVQNYYGQVLESKDDLQTSACCPVETMPADLKAYLTNIHPEIQERFYGCGAPIPPGDLTEQTILDLGCGTGRDVYLLSQIIGENGTVIGVDMTEEQLAVARAHEDWHQEKFGYTASNVVFHQGVMEDLAAIGIEDNTIDAVISNCVFNLSADKEKLFSEIYRVLKPPGQLYFSDIFAGEYLADELKDDPVLLGECLAGAMSVADFENCMRDIGYDVPKTISQKPIEITNSEIAEKIGGIVFHSITFQVFKEKQDGKCC